MKVDSEPSEASVDTDVFLSTMRSAWKAGIERDERVHQAASARRLARTVTPETEKARAQPLRQLLPLAVCVAACALLGLYVHRGEVSRRTNEIRAEDPHESPAVAPAAIEPVWSRSEPVESPSASASSSSSAMRPAPAVPPKAKNEPEALPPLPPPARSGDVEPAHGRRERLREIVRRRLPRPAPPPPFLPRHARKDRDL